MKKLVQSVMVVVAVVGLLFGYHAKSLSMIPIRTALSHPGPLPLGEGEWFADGLKCQATGFEFDARSCQTEDQMAASLTSQFLNQLSACAVH